MKLSIIAFALLCAISARAYNYSAPVYQGGAGNVTTLQATSSVTAPSFWGSGAHLTGIPSTSSISGSYVPLAGGVMTGALTVTGTSITANSFFGDASHLTGVAGAATVPASGVQSGWLGSGIMFSTANLASGVWQPAQLSTLLHGMTLDGTTLVSTITFSPSGENGTASYSENSVDNGNELDEHFRVLSGTTTGVWIDALDQSLAASTQPWMMVWGAAPCLDAECSPYGVQTGGGIHRNINNIDGEDGSISEFDAIVSTPGGYSIRMYGAASNDFSELNFLNFSSRDGIKLASSGGGIFKISPLGDVEAGSIMVSTVTSTGNLYAQGSIGVDGDAYIKGDATIEGGAYIDGEDGAYIKGDANIDGDAYIKGNADISEQLWAKNGLVVDNGATINGTASINGGSTGNGASLYLTTTTSQMALTAKGDITGFHVIITSVTDGSGTYYAPISAYIQADDHMWVQLGGESGNPILAPVHAPQVDPATGITGLFGGGIKMLAPLTTPTGSTHYACIDDAGQIIKQDAPCVEP